MGHGYLFSPRSCALLRGENVKDWGLMLSAATLLGTVSPLLSSEALFLILTSTFLLYQKKREFFLPLVENIVDRVYKSTLRGKNFIPLAQLLKPKRY